MIILSLTAPYPPQNISVRIVNLNKNNWEEQSGSFPEESFMRSQDTMGKDKLFHFTDDTLEIPSGNISSGWPDFNSSDYETTSQPYWWDSASATPESEDEFVSVLCLRQQQIMHVTRTRKGNEWKVTRRKTESTRILKNSVCNQAFYSMNVVTTVVYSNLPCIYLCS